ncbi:phosphotransferase [Clostridium tagluense]|uniref:phosphotransferase n=1 Tax=Clostridium tagluense TaxID=360422 RepID=UPI001C0BEA69|nr:phosphotransferase [Clostridium tagluense]MBU3129904.1 phosphotransferase [Clostridium tagluense]MCB2313532.1 phosphotransferase [Clostridium tagluense]MCB2318412.1 phosphotransferase [Clostridium tagluense]MCB2323213.1 phosphotransferase [Clostridium tagluense]MCB2328140.1 phosphotransferase [Clostridium tagluense]
MLKDMLNNKIYEYIKYNKLNRELNLGENCKVKFLAQGEYNINFTVEGCNKKYVFRVNTGSQIASGNQIRYEYEALRRLEVSGVTPKVYYVDDTKKELNYGVLIMEFLEGKPLEYHKDLNSAAEIFSKIHSIDIIKNNFKNLIIEEKIFTERINESQRLLKDFFHSPKIPLQLKEFFYVFVQWAEKNKYVEKYFLENKWHVVNNTEVNSSNFIIGREKSYLIDWEKPVISDPCQDLTQFLAPTTTLWKTDYILNREEKEEFFRAYVNGLKDKDNNIRERVELYNPFLYLRALSWCAYAYLEYQKEDKEIKNMDTYNKIKQYLDLDFMRGLLEKYFIA